MTLANPSHPAETSSRSEISHPSIRAKLDAATMALLQTRDQVIKSLDKHLSELHSLRLALADADNAAIVNQPMAAPVVSSSASSAQARHEPISTYGHSAQPTMILPSTRHDIEPTPAQPGPQPPRDMLNALQGLQNALLMKTPLTPQPIPMSEVFPDHLPEVQTHLSSPAPTSQAAPAFSLPAFPSPVADPAAAPLPPQFLSASQLGSPFPNHQAQQPQFHLPAGPAALPQPQHPFSLPSAVSQVSSASAMAPAMDGRNLFGSPSPAPTPPAFPQITMPPLAVGGISADVAREARVDSQMEQATLEDLNAALAFAFSQVSSPSQPLHSPMTIAVQQPQREAQHQQAAHPQWQLPQRA